MSCNSCPKEDPVDLAKHGLQYSLLPGATIALKSVIPPMRRPRGGWSVVLYIQGQKTTVPGVNPQDTAYNAERLLTLNEVLYTLPQLWLNLNIQWVERAIEKYQIVTLDDLLKIATPNY